MPSTSKAQHHLMTAVAHNAAFAKEVGIPQKVGKDFTAADKGGKFDAGDYRSDPHHKKARPRGKWHNQHSGHPKGA